MYVTTFSTLPNHFFAVRQRYQWFPSLKTSLLDVIKITKIDKKRKETDIRQKIIHSIFVRPIKCIEKDGKLKRMGIGTGAEGLFCYRFKIATAQDIWKMSIPRHRLVWTGKLFTAVYGPRMNKEQTKQYPLILRLLHLQKTLSFHLHFLGA